ncbi:hypothetical protein P9Z68_08280, partial [Glaesserella parasuis]|nr:hypothetical protein [Glaesserella parasuis]
VLDHKFEKDAILPCDHDLLNALPFHIHSIKQNHQQIAFSLFNLIRQKLQGKPMEQLKVECEIIWRR